MAKFMVKKRWVPDLVLCSPAERVRETWQLMAPVLGEGIPCKSLRTIYPGAPSRIMMVLHRANAAARTVLLIGHNPGLAVFAESLCGRGARKERERMSLKFPTAALAVIGFDIDRWSEVATGGGQLKAFVRPRDLD